MLIQDGSEQTTKTRGGFRLALWLILMLVGGLLAIAGVASSSPLLLKASGVTLFAAFAVGLFLNELAGYRFTFWILLANIISLLQPQWFISIHGFSLTNSWLLLMVIQLIMFGMGTQMSFRDFAQVAKMPHGVVVGLCCQFLIMPLIGFALAKLFGFPAEIGAGVILIGCCSCGLASNVLTFLAKGNLALSVSITAISTLIAPIMTPLWMKILAGSMVYIDPAKMSLNIIKMVLVPIIAAFVHDWLTNYGRSVVRSVYIAAAVSVVWLVFLMSGGWSWLQSITLTDGLVIKLLGLPGYFAVAVCFGLIYHYLTKRYPQIEKWMPKVSMAGIVYFTLVSTAEGRDHLLEVGLLLLFAAFLHNTLGYLLGYWGSRMLGMNRRDARTIAIEVGTQNGSMGIGIATEMKKLATLGLASIIFAPLMNVTGSILANYWRKSELEEST